MVLRINKDSNVQHCAGMDMSQVEECKDMKEIAEDAERNTTDDDPAI